MDKKYADMEQTNVDKKKQSEFGGTAQPKPMEANTVGRKLSNLTELQKEVKKYIIGQDKAIDRITLAIYRSIKIPSIKTNILIIGKSGSGKTETMKQVAKALNLPYTLEDATKYTKEGYYGLNVEEAVYNLFYNAEEDIEKAERGMIIIDEIDKKISNSFESDISGTDVLNSFLKLIEGTKVMVPMPPELAEVGGAPEWIDTSKMVVVFMGAFVGLEEECKKRLGKHQIGFGAEQNGSNSKKQEMRFTKDDLIAYGLPTEFAGRIDTIVQFETLTQESLARIARESKLSIFKKYENFLEENGITLEYQDSIFDDIAKQAISKNTGARELSNVANEIFEPILSKVFTAEPGQYKKCILKEDFVQNPETAYVLE